MTLPRSPLAPGAFPEMPSVPGVRMATAACGVRYPGRPDVVLFELAAGAAMAGVFTRSATAAAPVLWCRHALQQSGGRGRAVLVNAGNANAFTGRRGELAVNETVAAVAEALGCEVESVYPASTGVIGEPLPSERITGNVPGLAGHLSSAGWADAADAIRTTDTFAKGAARTVRVEGVDVTLAGIAKGSGMIQPDMATMLSFVFTDANLEPAALQALLEDANDRTFNCITVDGDTSTSDTVLLAATGQAGHMAIADPMDERLAEFREALLDLMRDLAQQVVRDGEGAQRFVTIRVSGARDRLSARRIGFAIANSPLVKTAVAGRDPNWGRIVMAVGKAGEPANRDRLAIAIGGIEIARAGEPVPDYDETPVQQHMAGREIDIAVDVGVGDGSATVWTCDLTHGYVDINADYRS